MEQKKRGMLAAVSTYLIWGVLPLYWNLLSAASAAEILAHRISWSFVFMLLVLAASKRWQSFCQDCSALRQNRRRALLLFGASILITINWLTYIWAVNHGHVIDTSLGYYSTPLMNVALGVILFKERLTPSARVSVLLAFCGVVLMTVQLGKLPWVALMLAVTFGLYGALKKKLALHPFSSITLETLLVLPVFLPYAIYLAGEPTSQFSLAAPREMLLLIGSGAATATPLILFSYGANLLPLNVLGFFQYLSPTIALLLGVFFFHEPFGMAQLSACACIWAALLIFTLSERVR